MPNKSIDTLVEDIYGVFDKGVKIEEEYVKEFGETLSKIVDQRINEERVHVPLRLSQLGEKCDRKSWFRANAHELAETLPPWTRLKFLYGDIIEALLLFLAKATGHKVEGEQDTVQIGGVKGHRDAIVDGRLVDVKSASTYGFKKFLNNGLRRDDPFGYLRQIGAYLAGSKGTGELSEEDVVSFLAMDKQNGHLVLDTYPADEVDYEELVEHKLEVIASSTPPNRYYHPVPEGKSGNQKLGIECSYCEFKKACYPGLRTFAYSTGPVFLTKVVREPNVPEV